MLTPYSEELTHWKRPWCWEGLQAGGEGDARGWDFWVASPTRWTWVWVNSGSWWWTGRPGMLWFRGSQWVGHDWVTELNRTEYSIVWMYHFLFIHSSTDGHLDCFYLLAVVNSAAMSLCVYVFKQTPVFNSMRLVELLDHIVILCLTFGGTATVFHSDWTVLHSHQHRSDSILLRVTF